MTAPQNVPHLELEAFNLRIDADTVDVDVLQLQVQLARIEVSP